MESLSREISTVKESLSREISTLKEPLVLIDRLTKTFKGMDTPALQNISARIGAGKMTGLVGPDGAGKTTLIRHIVGLMHPDSGSIHVDGHDTTKQAEAIHKIIGYMPQKFGLYEDLTVFENLRLYADLRNVIGEKRTEQFKKLLDFTALSPFQSRLVGKLSGGMKQKLGLACALLGEPKLLLLDEPSVGVDPISRRELWTMVQGLLGGGMAVIWATSYLDEAERCETVLLLHEGEMLHNGPPSDLLQRVEGRTWALQGLPPIKKRRVLMDLLQEGILIDGSIQGNEVRGVIAHGASSPPKSVEGTWHPTKPCFEDAFIDLLGARQSKLVAGHPQGQSEPAAKSSQGQAGLAAKSSHGQSALTAQMTPKTGTVRIVIDAQALTKCFGDFTAVLENTFQIKRGEIFGLLGPNGAGKSTSFKMLCGLLQPTKGKAFVMGLDLKTASSEARGRIGYMAQTFSLYGALSVKQNLAFFAGVYGLSAKRQQEQIAMMCDVFGLEKYSTVKAEDLPLGYKQRLALACALMHEPDVLFLDEPTSGVDPITRREFWGHINALVEKGVTIMVTTHFMEEAEYCDRIALLYHGKNIATGSPDDLKELAAKISGKTMPTMEEAFITLIEQQGDKAIADEI